MCLYYCVQLFMLIKFPSFYICTFGSIKDVNDYYMSEILYVVWKLKTNITKVLRIKFLQNYTQMYRRQLIKYLQLLQQ